MAAVDAIIVGAGHNGLICAAYLARAGVNTLVLERRDILGGACVTEEIPRAPSHRISTGAAQLGNLPPEIIRDLDLVAHGYDFMLPDPLSVFPRPDGSSLTIWQDPARTLDEIRRFSHADAEALAPFQKECGQFCDILEPALQTDDVPSVDDISALFDRAGRPSFSAISSRAASGTFSAIASKARRSRGSSGSPPPSAPMPDRARQVPPMSWRITCSERPPASAGRPAMFGAA